MLKNCVVVRIEMRIFTYIIFRLFFIDEQAKNGGMNRITLRYTLNKCRRNDPERPNIEYICPGNSQLKPLVHQGEHE